MEKTQPKSRLEDSRCSFREGTGDALNDQKRSWVSSTMIITRINCLLLWHRLSLKSLNRFQWTEHSLLTLSLGTERPDIVNVSFVRSFYGSWEKYTQFKRKFGEKGFRPGGESKRQCINRKTDFFFRNTVKTLSLLLGDNQSYTRRRKGDFVSDDDVFPSTKESSSGNICVQTNPL